MGQNWCKPDDPCPQCGASAEFVCPCQTRDVACVDRCCDVCCQMCVDGCCSVCAHDCRYTFWYMCTRLARYCANVLDHEQPDSGAGHRERVFPNGGRVV